MSEYSDTEDPIQESAKLKQLENTVSLLTKENDALKAQFESAMEIAKQLQETRKSNDEQRKEIRSLQRANEDLQHRLEIMNQTLNEKNQEFEEEKKLNQTARGAENKTAQKEIEKTRNEANAKVEKIEKMLKNEKQEKNDLERIIKEMNAKETKLCESASFYLQENIQSYDNLISYFEETMANAPQTSSPTKNENTEESAKYETLRKKYKTLQRKAQEKIQNYEQEIEKLNKNIRDSEFKHNKEIAKLEDKVKTVEEDAQLKEKNQNSQISLLEGKIENLKSEIVRTKSRMSQEQTESMISLSQPIVQHETPIRQRSLPPPPKQEKIVSEIAFDQMTLRNDELSTQLKEATAKKEDATQRLSTALQELEIAKADNEKQKHSYNALSIAHSETCAELESLRKTVNTEKKQTAEKDQQAVRKEISNYKAKISLLENSLETQKQIAHEANVELANVKADLAQATIYSNRLDAEIKKYDNKIKEVNAQLAEAELKTKPTLTEDDLLPITAWHYPGFSNELAQEVSAIAQNKTMQTSSRLQNSFKAICEYYENLLNKCKSEFNEKNDEFHEFHTIVDKFIVDASIALNGKPVTIEEFLMDSGDSLVDDIAKLRKDSDDYIRKLTLLDSIIKFYKETFEVDSDDIIASIQNVKDYIVSKEKELDGRSRRVKELKSTLDEFQKKSKADINNLTQENKELSETLKETEEKLKLAKTELSSLKHEKEDLNIELRELRESKETLETTLIDNKEELEQSHEQSLMQLQNSLTQQINDAEQKLEETTEELNEANEEIEKLNQIVESQKNQIDQKDKQLAETVEEKKNLEAQGQSIFEQERSHIISSYESAISEIKKQNDERRKDSERLAADLQTSENDKKELKKKLGQMRREKKNLEENLRIANEQFEREKRLIETKHTAEIMKLDAEYLSKSNEQEEEHEKEKAGIFTFATTEFNQFYRPSSSLNERTFRELIIKTKEELTKLTKSDQSIRRMTKAGDKQTTEDAVAQLVMKK